MTASISTTPTGTVVDTASAGVLPGFRALTRKELTEWRRARRSWVAFAVSTLFMVLGSMNAWILRLLPADVTAGEPLPPLDPVANLTGPISTHVFVIVAIFAVMAVIASERESGTLAWTASKPVSRSAIWMAKFASASCVMWVLVVLAPLALTLALVALAYGAVPASTVAALAVGMGATVLLYVAVSLAASTVVTSQAAVAGIALVVISVAPMLAQLLPDPTLMPTSSLDWWARLGSGESVAVAAPILWVGTVVALIAFSLRRMERIEL